MIAMVKRFLLVYFRDKLSVFFSLLSIIITVGLYILFLSELQIDSIKSIFGDNIPENLIDKIVHSWIISGLLSIIPATSALGTLGTIVFDREKKKIPDFIISPQNKFVYPVSAIFSACIVGLMMSLIAFLIYGIYMYLDCGLYLEFWDYVKSILIILYSSVLSSTFMGFFVSFLKTGSSFSTLSIIVGTLIGFLTGIYVPIGILPQAIQNIVMFFPFSHIAVLFRDLLMAQPINQLVQSVDSQLLVEGNLLNEYKELYGIEFTIGSHTISNLESILYILVVIIISTVLFAFNFNRKKKNIN